MRFAVGTRILAVVLFLLFLCDPLSARRRAVRQPVILPPLRALVPVMEPTSDLTITNHDPSAAVVWVCLANTPNCLVVRLDPLETKRVDDVTLPWTSAVQTVELFHAGTIETRSNQMDAVPITIASAQSVMTAFGTSAVNQVLRLYATSATDVEIALLLDSGTVVNRTMMHLAPGSTFLDPRTLPEYARGGGIATSVRYFRFSATNPIVATLEYPLFAPDFAVGRNRQIAIASPGRTGIVYALATTTPFLTYYNAFSETPLTGLARCWPRVVTQSGREIPFTAAKNATATVDCRADGSDVAAVEVTTSGAHYVRQSIPPHFLMTEAENTGPDRRLSFNTGFGGELHSSNQLLLFNPSANSAVAHLAEYDASGTIVSETDVALMPKEFKAIALDQGRTAPAGGLLVESNDPIAVVRYQMRKHPLTPERIGQYHATFVMHK